MVLALAWSLEITPEGFTRDSRPRGRGASKLRPAIAVLPFSNMSSDLEVEHLADGLTDNLITECQRRLPVPVTSRNSTFVYKNQPIAIPVAARELDVAYVLEGSIQKQGETIRVTAQLIHGADDSHLWADHFDKKLDDVFAIQDQLTGTIIDGLQSALATIDESVQEVRDTLVGRISRLPSILTLSLGGIVAFGFVLLLAVFAPATLNWTETVSTTGLGWLAFIVAVASGAALFGFFRTQGRKRRNHVIEAIVPEIEQHVADGHLQEAFDLAMANRTLLPAHLDDAWWDQFSAPASIDCAIPNAALGYRPYNGRNVEWTEIPPPFQDVRLPLGNIQLNVAAPGYVAQQFCTANPSMMLQNSELRSVLPPEVVETATPITLEREEDAIPGMMSASDRHVGIALVGLPAPKDPVLVAGFHIDRYPVSNADYEAFVRGGGYTNAEFWQDLPWPDGTNWRERISEFVDATGRPGPADWELGKPKDGEEDLPVSGISWYETAAYAQFAGKRLPTVWEWCRAALPFDSNGSTINVALMGFANFFGKGKSRPGDYPAMSAVGAWDMFGNVREWVWNEVGTGRGNLGGGHSDEPYYAVWLNSDDPFARSLDTGFRCVTGPVPNELQARPISRVQRSYEGEAPVSDEVYAALVESIRPKPRPTRFEVVAESEIDGNRRLEFSVETGYGGRFPIVTIAPGKDHREGSLIVFPGMGSFFGGDADDDLTLMFRRLSFLVNQLNYTLLFPRFTGMNERHDGGPFPRSDFREVWHTRAHHWTQELSQAIQLAEEHPDLDHERLGFLGISYGAIFTTAAVALQPEFKTIVLLSGNMQVTSMIPVNDSINHYPRIKAPTLMMNGRFDSIVSPDKDLLDLRYRLLGTPEEHKRQILYDAGHFPYPQHLFKKDLSDWLEKYL